MNGRMDLAGALASAVFSLFVAGCGGTGADLASLNEPSGGTGGEASSSTQPNESGDPLPFAGAAEVSWDAPTTNVDGTPLTDLAGYRVYYGQTTPLSKSNSAVVVHNATMASLTGLQSGTYYFAVTAFDLDGSESDLSGEVSKTIL